MTPQKGETRLAELANSKNPKVQYQFLRDKFRKYRTAAQVAKALNVAQSTIDSWLRGLNVEITVDLAPKRRPIWQEELEKDGP